MEISTLRLTNQHLLGKKLTTPEEIVLHLGAVQSQDYAAAKWALGQRLTNAKDIDIEQAFNEGKILRTHVLRPTWHFVHPMDISSMLDLTAPRVKQLMSHYNSKLELDENLFTKSNNAIVSALKQQTYLTRQELKKILENNNIKTDVQRLAHIIMLAELDGLIISGPRRGKQFTYGLFEKRVPKPKKLTRDESLAALTRKYFQSHGPAQLKDFAWWSGLSIKEANQALDPIKSKLFSETINEKKYYFTNSQPMTKNQRANVFLLSIYDEYVISYKDRTDLSDNKGDIEHMISMGNALTAVIIIEGKLTGTWKREIKKDNVLIKVTLFRKLTSTENLALEKAAENYAKFLNLTPKLLL